MVIKGSNSLNEVITDLQLVMMIKCRMLRAKMPFWIVKTSMFDVSILFYET